MDTSIGEMRVLFPQSLLVIGIGYIPVVVLLLLCSVLWAVLLAFGPGDSSSQELGNASGSTEVGVVSLGISGRLVGRSGGMTCRREGMRFH